MLKTGVLASWSVSFLSPLEKAKKWNLFVLGKSVYIDNSDRRDTDSCSVDNKFTIDFAKNFELSVTLQKMVGPVLHPARKYTGSTIPD